MPINPADSLPLYITLERAAHLLDCSTRTVRRMIDRGDVNAVRLAGTRSVRIETSSLLARVVPSTPAAE